MTETLAQDSESGAVFRMLADHALGESPSIAERRSRLERLTAALPMPEAVAVEPVALPRCGAELLVPAGARPGRTLLFLRGGGFVTGSLATHRALPARIGQAAGARVLNVDYRLAPEHPFPAALDDARDAYAWLRGREAGRIALVGATTGGTLALGLLAALRDAGEPLPVAAALLSPWTDLSGSARSLQTHAGRDPGLNAQDVRELATLYLQGSDPRTPLASPQFADVHGLPPLLIQVGSEEVLLDDSTHLARWAEAGEVETTLEVWPGMMHGWHQFWSMLAPARDAIDRIAAFLEPHWA
ncbi:MAG TPA: alpha/beta hydrolase, partial [Alphaproteobacteria bacterium]|nr:alpha/beta hydrolase [Alphaproteobacteria bacterium]